MILESERVKLVTAVKGEDWDYFADLVTNYKFTRVISIESAYRSFEFYNFVTMIGYADGIRSGVVFSNLVPGLGYTADFYYDRHTVPDVRYPYYMDGAKLFLDFLFTLTDKVFAVIDSRDRKLKKFVELLDFDFIEADGNLITLMKRSINHGSTPNAFDAGSTDADWSVTSGS